MSKTTNKFSPEVRARAVRLVLDRRDILRLIRSVGGVIGHERIVADQAASRQ